MTPLKLYKNSFLKSRSFNRSRAGFLANFHKQISNPVELILSVRGTTFSLYSV